MSRRMSIAKPFLGAAMMLLHALPAAHAQTTVPDVLDGIGHVRAVPVDGSRGFAHQRVRGGVQVRLDGVTKTVLFYAPNVVRVNAHLGESHWEHPSLVVIRSSGDIPIETRESAGVLSLVGASLRIDVDKRTGALTFIEPGGRVMTRERADAPQSIERREISGAPTYEVENRFTLKPREGIYGFGFTADDEVNRRNKELLLVQTNVGTIIPVMVSTERYGILWDTYSMMRFTDDAEGARLWAESAPGGVDYYFMAGQTLDEVVAAYRWLTGDAPMYPKQAFGLFMSKERYPTQERTVEVARTFRREQFPLDYIVQDWQYWGSDKDGTWSGMIWDAERFPDPEGMIRSIHDLNMKLMVSIWPSVGNDTPLGRELDEHGLRFEPLHWISRQARVYDAFSPLGREIYFKHIKSGLLDKGVDALWMDGTEVEVSSAMWNAMDNVRDIKALGRNALGDFARYLNPYSLVTTQGTYDGQRATSNQRVFTLTRSGWAGAQRTAAASWSGDIFASWRTYRQQIAGGLNVTVTGNPYWTHDIGGFFVNNFPGGEQNAAYRELFARWFQYGAFNPIMRIHGTSIEREPYIFRTMDPPMYESLLDAVHLRYRLLPYIYSLSARVTADGYTLMRPLPMDFTADTATYHIDDSFMFGSSLLVHPVTRAMYNRVLPPAQAVPAGQLRSADGRPGLDVQYFAGQNFETLRGRLVDATIDHTWPDPPLAELPAGLTELNHFSARWAGELIAPEDGEYELGLSGDDGFRLFLHGEKVIEDWNHGAERYRSIRRSLRRDERVPVTIEFFQGTGDRVLRFAWRTPSELRALAAAQPDIDLSMSTYLPGGTDWYDFWTHQRHPGGQTVTRDAPLNIIPLYVRAGSIIPLGPVVQYATERPDAPYEIRVFPGADGRFTIYEDDNETYDYENGASTRYELVWDDARRTLIIGARDGTFPGMVAQRTLNIVIAGAGNATGIGAAPASRSVEYTGEPITLRFE